MNKHYQTAIKIAQSKLEELNSELYRNKYTEMLDDIYNGVEELDYPSDFFDKDGEIINMEAYNKFQHEYADSEAQFHSSNVIKNIEDLESNISTETALEIIKEIVENIGFDYQIIDPRGEVSSFYILVDDNEDKKVRPLKIRFSDHSPKYNYDWCWIEGNIKNAHATTIKKMIDMLIKKKEVKNAKTL